MSGVRSLLIHNHKKGMRSWELPGSLGTLWRSFICNGMGSSHSPEPVVIPSHQNSPGCREQLWEWYFLKQRSLSKPEMFGRRDWRWKCDLKLPSLKCRWLWTECLKTGAVSIRDVILITATKKLEQKWFCGNRKQHCENVGLYKCIINTIASP